MGLLLDENRLSLFCEVKDRPRKVKIRRKEKNRTSDAREPKAPNVYIRDKGIWNEYKKSVASVVAFL